MSNLGVREWNENDFIDLIKIENLLYYLGIKNEILSFILIKKIKYEAEIINISIGPKFQRKGFGSKLLDYITHSKDWVDGKKYTLEVSVVNIRAKYFYESMGFQRVAIRKNY